MRGMQAAIKTNYFSFFMFFNTNYRFFSYLCAQNQTSFGFYNEKSLHFIIQIQNIMAKFIEEFKEFAFKGNVMDMAVGVIIGGAFGKIVSSIVGDLIMPLVAAIWDVNVSDLKIELKPGVPEVVNEAGEVVTEAIDAVTWNYGAFCQNVLDFFIIAICLFFIVKAIAKASALRKKKEAEEAAAAPEPEPTKEEVLLTEIRDLLKEKK